MRKIFNSLVTYFPQVMLLLIFITVSLQVFFRYVLKSPIQWSQEIAVLFFIWLTFTGTILCVRDNKQLRLDYFVEKMPYSVKRYFKILHKLLILLVLVFIIISGVLVVREFYSYKMPASGLSMAFYYSALPISAIVMFFIVIFKKNKI